MLQQLLSDFRSRPGARIGLAFLFAANALTVTAFAGAPSAATGTSKQSSVEVCSRARDSAICSAIAGDGLAVSLPDGAQQCPGSGVGAACVTSDGAADIVPGTASTPSGLTACASDAAAPSSTLAACSDAVLPGNSAADSSAPRDGSGAPVSSPAVAPSVPLTTLRPAA
ncbi:MAG TPA: hypothetical protein VLK30_10520, partial [Candidatus Limnocylindrales bacterium]|nr:hypothetical protein [Candidatus Limnocylindrales bacterium]